MVTDLPAAMAALVDGVTRVVVIDGGVANGRALGDHVLCTIDGDDTARLLAHLAVSQPAQGFHCMCRGDQAIELWNDRRRRATIGLHHGVSVRVDGWPSDAPLVDGEGLLRALADHGVPGPLAAFHEQQAMSRAAESRRVDWCAAAPDPIRGRLAALESTDPRGLSDSDAGHEALAALRAELGGDAAAALFGWYGGPGGPWTGYPAYESIAEGLIRGLAIDEWITAGEHDDPAVLLGLARWIARHDAPPRERARIDAPLRERLIALVRERGDNDMQARIFAALGRPPPEIEDARRIADAEYSPSLSRPVACAGAWAAIDGDRVIRFDRGATRGAAIVTLPSAQAALAAVDRDLVVTLGRVGEVWRVPIGGGAPQVIATGQARPSEPAAIDGRAAWIEQAPLASHRTGTRLRVEGDDEPVHEHADGAWDLIACDGALWWARHGGSLWSTIFGKKIHRADLMRCDPHGREVAVARVLEGGDDGTSWPRLFTDGRTIAWTSGRRIGALTPRSGDLRWFEVDADILAIHPLDDGVLVTLAREHVGELILLEGGGARSPLARWSRPLWSREQLAVAGGEVVWNTEQHLWAIPSPRRR